MNGRAQIDLSTFAVIFVLARELLALELVEHLADGFCWLGQHRLQGHSGGQLANLLQSINADIKECWDDKIVAGQLANSRIIL